MAIIKCQSCGNDVSDKAKQCPHCGTTINDENGIESLLNNVKVKTETSNNKRIYNRVAKKFDLVVWIIKFLGYLGGIISLIIFANLNNFGLGLIVYIITCIMTWLSTLLFEAISERFAVARRYKKQINKI